ncbi:hypothetical protein GCM10023147_47460 [Tsukamurella soli]|uniref:Alpha-1,2-mannosyltransferase n=1 Tax=Tsukamurella soli TaxID=644556 RepID=A0ABP8KEJ2_9ACTN
MAAAALVISVASRLIWVFAGPHNFNFVDLRVYYEAAHRVVAGGLYDFALTEYTPRQPLPFTYPPFAAIVFTPLHAVPFPVVALGWLILTVVLLYLVIAMSLAMLRAARGESPALRDVPRSTAMLWTAGVLWLDPVRTNLDYGQINVVLMALGVWAAFITVRYAPGGGARYAPGGGARYAPGGGARYAPGGGARYAPGGGARYAPGGGEGRWGGLRPAWSDGAAGALVGIAAGIKLTPAVGGLFLLARKRWWAAVASGVVFAATVGFGYVLLPAESRRYFTVLIGDTGPIGDPAKPDNQSLRGALSRFAGHDLGSGPAVLIAIGVAAVALLAAWWVCRRGDALIALVLAQSFGLFASPISWIHHWVWIVPTLVWLVHGASGATGGVHGASGATGGVHGASGATGVWARALAVAYAAYSYVGVHGWCAVLGWLHIDSGPVWALALCPNVVATVGLVALILAGAYARRGGTAVSPG